MRATLNLFVGSLVPVLALRVLNVGLAFGVAALLARALEPQAMGAYFLFVSVALPLSILSQWGTGLAGLGRVANALAAGQQAEARDGAAAAVRTALVGAGILAAVCAAAGAVAVAISSSDWAPAGLVTVGMLAALLGLQGTASDVLRGFRRPLLATWIGGVAVNLLMFVALLASRVAGTVTLPVALGLLLGSYVLSFAIALVILARSGVQPLRGGASTPPGWSRNLPLIGTQLVALVFTSTDLWLAGALLSLEDAALYGAATRIAQILILPIEATETGVASLLARARSGEQAGLRSMLQRTTQVQALATALGLGILFAVGDFILALAFGEGYREALPVVLVLGAGIVARAATGPNAYALLMAGDARLLLRRNAACALLFLPLEAVAAHLGGLVGLAAVSALAVCALHGWLAWTVRARLGLNLTILGGSSPAIREGSNP